MTATVDADGTIRIPMRKRGRDDLLIVLAPAYESGPEYDYPTAAQHAAETLTVREVQQLRKDLEALNGALLLVLNEF